MNIIIDGEFVNVEDLVRDLREVAAAPSQRPAWLLRSLMEMAASALESQVVEGVER